MTFGSERAARLADRVRLAFDAYLDTFESRTVSRIERAVLGKDPSEVGYEICSMMPFDTFKRQQLLEASCPGRLLESLFSMLRRERELLVSTRTGGANVMHPGTGFSTN